MEVTFGIYEPKGSVIILFLATLFLGTALYSLWNIKIKKVFITIVTLSDLIALFPLILLLFQLGKI
jgi:hypothetical protein